MIRLMQDDKEEMAAVLRMCADFWQTTSLKDNAFDPIHTESMIRLSMNQGLLLVLEIDGMIQGFISGLTAPLLACGSVSHCVELAWWVNPESRSGRNGIRLLNALEESARSRGCKYTTMISMESNEPEKVNRIYHSLGYRHTETSFTKEL